MRKKQCGLWVGILFSFIPHQVCLGQTLAAELVFFGPGDFVEVHVEPHRYSVFTWTGIEPLVNWQPSNGRTIESFSQKFGFAGRYLLLLSDGSVYQADVTAESMTRPSRIGTVASSKEWSQIVGDALYALTYSGDIYISRNDGTTWQIDTVGLNTAFPFQLDLDSSQYVYAATNKGLYRQHPDSSTWRRMDSLYVMSASQIVFPDLISIHVDKRNFLYAGSPYRGMFVSRNNGVQWTLDTAGIGIRPASRSGNDAYGNVYAITSGSDNRIYRSSDTGRTWTRIDESLSGLKLDPRNQFPFFDIGGDSSITLATYYGAFVSTNQGDTWSESSAERPVSTVYALLRVGGRTLISTHQGLFHRSSGAGSWTKSFPTNGYLGGLHPQSDAAGNLYTTGESPSLSTTAMFYKSTDQGTTWMTDTAGHSILKSFGIFYVDESGNQHYSVQWTGGVLTYVRAPSGQWGLDTAGLKSGSSADQPNAFVSDRNGMIYLAGKFSGGNMWRRPTTGGAWSLDTAGLGTRIPEKLTVDREGNPLAIVAVEFPKHAIYRRLAGVWIRLAHPAIGPSASQISVDSSGTLWASLYNDPNNLLGVQEIRNRGVHVSTDNGATWMKVGVDSTVVLGLVSYGDTTYVLTQGRGLQALTSEGPVSGTPRQMSAVPGRFRLYANYPNPFNPRTVIEYEISARSKIVLKVFDLLGREVAVLVDEVKDAGRYREAFDASFLTSGVYICRMTSGTVSLTRKLVLIR